MDRTRRSLVYQLGGVIWDLAVGGCLELSFFRPAGMHGLSLLMSRDARDGASGGAHGDGKSEHMHRCVAVICVVFFITLKLIFQTGRDEEIKVDDLGAADPDLGPSTGLAIDRYDIAYRQQPISGHRSWTSTKRQRWQKA